MIWMVEKIFSLALPTRRFRSVPVDGPQKRRTVRLLGRTLVRYCRLMTNFTDPEHASPFRASRPPPASTGNRTPTPKGELPTTCAGLLLHTAYLSHSHHGTEGGHRASYPVLSFFSRAIHFVPVFPVLPTHHKGKNKTACRVYV